MSTKTFKITSRDGVIVRDAAHSPNGRRLGGIGYDQTVIVRADSRTVQQRPRHVWWELVDQKDSWVASGTLDANGTMTTTYMEEIIYDHEKRAEDTTAKKPTETTKDDKSEIVKMRVVTDQLSVRSQPQLGNQYRIDDQWLYQGDEINLLAPSQRADNFVWWEHADNRGWWSASGSVTGGEPLMLPPDKITASGVGGGKALNTSSGNTGKPSQPEVDTNDMYMMTVPWITQIQWPKNYSNDCGHACLLMKMSYQGFASDVTVRDMYFYQVKGQPVYFKNGNGTTNTTHLKRMANRATNGQMKITEFRRNASRDTLYMLKNILRQNRPLILLVWYPDLKLKNPSGGSFDHWIVLTGFKGDTFYMHDPLWVKNRQSSGEDIPIDADTLIEACRSTRSAGTVFLGVY